jgi:Kdo2-lipid IVA lauroyltransferase/acyltransferase
MTSFQRSIFFIEYLFFRFLAFLFNLLSVYQSAAFADFIGSALYKFMKKRRETAVLNLRAAFPEKNESEIQALAKASMQNMVKVALEFIRIPKIMRHEDISWEIRGLEYCRKALEGNKGFVVTVSHFGNWELMGLAAANAGLPLHAIARPIKNPFVYNYIKHLRLVAGYQSIDKDGAARATIKLLKQNKMIAMLIDQHERQGSVRVDFFGRDASTSTLPAILALKYKVPIIPTFFYRERPNFFIHTFDEPFKIIDTGNYEADLVANTQQYVSRIEEEIRKRPADWLWMHRRWRELK